MDAVRASGYLMEQEVASEFEQLGFTVRTNVPFEDPDELKSREIDVQAVQPLAVNREAKLAARAELLVECKNSTNPFVFIARPKNHEDKETAPMEFLFPYPSYQKQKHVGPNSIMTRQISPYYHLGFQRVHREYEQAWKAVQFCRIDRKGKQWSANHGGIYDSIFYPMAKALKSRHREIPIARQEDEWRYLWLFFPLIVTSGDLFLIDSAADDPQPLKVDHVTFKRELKSESLDGTFALTFVRQQNLTEFVQSVLQPIIDLAIELVESRGDFVKQRVLPWEE